MHDLLEQESDTTAFRIKVPGDQPRIENALLGLDEVAAVTRIEDSDDYRIECAPGSESANRLLAAVLELDIPIEGFQKDLRHLNDAFMDLTEQGVR
jgi:ABC-2 type transport system ATP-binding protein